MGTVYKNYLITREEKRWYIYHIEYDNSKGFHHLSFVSTAATLKCAKSRVDMEIVKGGAI